MLGKNGFISPIVKLLSSSMFIFFCFCRNWITELGNKTLCFYGFPETALINDGAAKRPFTLTIRGDLIFVKL